MKNTVKTAAFINTISKPPARSCSRCGEGYFRRNRMEVWTGWAPGKRLGWHKDIVAICLKCQDLKESMELIEIADIRYSKKEIARPKKK